MSRHQNTRRQVPAGIQFFSIILYAGFAISTSIVAMDQSLWVGAGLAALYAYFWSRIPTLSGGYIDDADVEAVKPSVPDAAPASSGNASFDAYRRDMLARLESEQDKFEGFLSRLRDAKDKSEFDDFMENRATAARAATGKLELRQPEPS